MLTTTEIISFHQRQQLSKGKVQLCYGGLVTRGFSTTAESLSTSKQKEVSIPHTGRPSLALRQLPLRAPLPGHLQGSDCPKHRLLLSIYFCVGNWTTVNLESWQKQCSQQRQPPNRRLPKPEAQSLTTAPTTDRHQDKALVGQHMINRAVLQQDEGYALLTWSNSGIRSRQETCSAQAEHSTCFLHGVDVFTSITPFPKP